ncbi:beta-galactosidase [Paenibacillus sp. S150]|uniref:beta-galactosidase n=1 Tax=Paenibacillus sp. S150 TaxID=2749826 RepID=UPI001C57A8A3|nr:beta-galactosidase [Paenibacillus sp. S150]MBW4085409.1 beta-galactosidase [Paenibacillus sp. S150]
MVYHIQAGIAPKEIYPATLRLGGTNPQGDQISFTNYYMELNGKPYFAVCGEFHYSRYPEDSWEAEIRKMKISGINIVATYIFWNHHEELEGHFEWQGNRNLRKFVELCARNGLYVILRVGPFCHGEVRNGGLPDWLFGRSFDVRSNDEGYLQYVHRLFQEIGAQASGQMFKDGGPVVGIQLENEFNAAAALWELTAKQGDEYLSGGIGGEAGAEHMRILKQYAVDAGMVAPVYTSTGWGAAPFLEDEVLPLYGGYAYTPWSISEQNPDQKPTPEYVFVNYHHEESETGEFDPPYSKTKYPFACCEMGGGMQTWYLSRFRVEPESVMAMSLMKIGGGCNFVGYYMFHGGTNPVGKTGYLNESTTPRITYDFQAPIGEFGQVRDSAHLLRPLHYFLRRFAGRLAPMATVLPQGAEAITPEDAHTLRYAVRTDGSAGFLFVNNYQDHVEMDTHKDVRFAVQLAGETIDFPRKSRLAVRRNASFILPFNFALDGLNLRYATAQPVTVVESSALATYFFSMPEGIDGEFMIAAGEGITTLSADAGTVEQDAEGNYTVLIPHDRSAMIRIEQKGSREIRIYAMSAREASMLWELEEGGQPRLIFSEIPPVQTEDGLEFFSSGQSSFSFREYAGGPAAAAKWTTADAGCSIAQHNDAWFHSYEVKLPAKEIRLETRKIHDHKIALHLAPGTLDGAEEVLLSIDYTGNVGYAFSGGELFHDHFHNGAPWEIGLSRFRDTIRSGEIILETTPLRTGVTTVAADAAMAVEKQFTGEATAVFRSVTAVPVYRVGLTK